MDLREYVGIALVLLCVGVATMMSGPERTVVFVGDLGDAIQPLSERYPDLPPDRAELQSYVDAIRNVGGADQARWWLDAAGLSPSVAEASQLAVDRALRLARENPIQMGPPGH